MAMTEPPPGAGSDPTMLQTSAVRDGDDYLINGTKRFITGAEGAAYTIVMARMEDGSASMFLADMDRPGIRLSRRMESLDSCFAGGHAEMQLENLRVPATDVLGEIGKGFRYAQVRLAPARLTHCMRWLGQARRAHDVALDYVRKREAFGKPLLANQFIQFKLAELQTEVEAIGALLHKTVGLYVAGNDVTQLASMCKLKAARVARDTADPLERRLVNVVEEMVNMIETQRAYEINSKAISSVDGMLKFLNQNI